MLCGSSVQFRITSNYKKVDKSIFIFLRRIDRRCRTNHRYWMHGDKSWQKHGSIRQFCAVTLSFAGAHIRLFSISFAFFLLWIRHAHVVSSVYKRNLNQYPCFMALGTQFNILSWTCVGCMNVEWRLWNSKSICDDRENHVKHSKRSRRRWIYLHVPAVATHANILDRDFNKCGRFDCICAHVDSIRLCISAAINKSIKFNEKCEK